MLSIVLGLFGGWLKAAGQFIAVNWRWLLPIAAVLLLWWYIAHLQSQRDNAIQALAEYKRNVKVEAEKRKAENAAREQAATDHINQVLADHAAEIDRIRRYYDAQHGKDEAAHAGDIAQWRNWLRNAVAADGLPEIPGPAEGAAEIGRDGHAAAAGCDAVRAGCAVTTADYNALWSAWHDACAIHGCTK